MIFNYSKSGLITTYGNGASHEAVLTRLSGIPSLINLQGADFKAQGQGQGIVLEDKTVLYQGDMVVLDADNNALFVAQDDVLEEDTTITDASYGLDIPAFRKEFTSPYLRNGSIQFWRFSVKDFRALNQGALAKYEALLSNGTAREIFLANLEKHFMHDLLEQAIFEENGRAPGSDLPVMKFAKDVAHTYWYYWKVLSYYDPENFFRFYNDPLDYREEISALAESISKQGQVFTGQGIVHIASRALAKRVLRAIYRKLLTFYVEKESSNKPIFQERELMVAIAKALGRNTKRIARDIEFFKAHPSLQKRLDYINNNEGFLLYVGPFKAREFGDYLPLLGDEATFEEGTEENVLHSVMLQESLGVLVIPDDAPAQIIEAFRGRSASVSFSGYFDYLVSRLKNCCAMNYVPRDVASFIDTLSERLEETASSSLNIPNADMATKGGIDFNADKMSWETRFSGQSIEFKFTPEQLRQLQTAAGFIPVIMNIEPLINLPLFLGLNKDDTLAVAAAKE